jgi:hypothetical protein
MAKRLTTLFATYTRFNVHIKTTITHRQADARSNNKEDKQTLWLSEDQLTRSNSKEDKQTLWTSEDQLTRPAHEETTLFLCGCMNKEIRVETQLIWIDERDWNGNRRREDACMM